MAEQLVEPASRHYAFIINPVAGKRNTAQLRARIDELFEGENLGDTFEVIMTDRQGHASEIAADLAVRHGGHLVAVACGGDGTANEVANGIAGTPAAMAVLPYGTGNDMVRTVYPDRSAEWLLQHIRRPDIRPIDVIQLDDRICLNIMSLGFDTKVQRRAIVLAARAPWLGGLIYPLSIVVALFGRRDYPMHYELQTIDDQGRPGTVAADARFVLAAICNGRYYGGGFNPAPQADLADGKLDFCLVESIPLLRMLSLIPLYKQGRHLSDPAVHSCQITGGMVAAPTGLLLGNYDGESFEKAALHFQVRPLALRFAFFSD
jgi:diacylglycerol kinase (ATP)